MNRALQKVQHVFPLVEWMQAREQPCFGLRRYNGAGGACHSNCEKRRVFTISKPDWRGRLGHLSRVAVQICRAEEQSPEALGAPGHAFKGGGVNERKPSAAKAACSAPGQCFATRHKGW